MKETICPHCKRPLYDEEALFCHFCGESLKRPSQGLCGKIKYGHFKIISVILIVILIIIFALLSLR